MHTRRLIFASLAVLVSLAFSGCATVRLARDLGPEPDLNVVTIGAAKKDVQKELGRPIREEHNVAVYEYRTRSVSPGLAAFMLPIAALVELSGWGLLLTAENASRIDRLHTHQMDIVYGPDERVIALSHRDLEQKFRNWLRAAEPDRQLGEVVLAADGYAPAQFTQALRYRYGLWDTPADPAAAYMWARLAEFGGHPGARETMARWAKTMTSLQLADGERRFREWKPASGR